MLVVTGVISLAALATVSAAVVSLIAVTCVTWAFWSQRLPVLGRWPRSGVAALGVTAAVTGVTIADGSPQGGRSLVAIGVALLTTAAMLALTLARTADVHRGGSR